MSLADTYIVFELDSAAYAVRSSDVQHLEMLEHVTRVPNTAAAVDGVVFSRGQVYPAINLRARFGLPRRPYDARTRLIFLKVQERVVALIVDSAREFQRIPAESIRPIEETLVGIAGNHVEGVATIKGRSVLILNVGVVLTLEEMTVPAGAAEAAGQPVSPT
ncbi:chemotaxis protein CheW [Opitutus terrae]|uniref:CheW protein n=1 Tax=Opitutus terrae (strain DSM 11246 / JCM 15787 / PB90-1) TaxID=452637 RepID=B1ZY70_OPITP|nr:chemotaxis protein CheW [Opitutus terrae]ACB76216.1 CheW protein [Opitutus terrae PB90-1]